MYFGGLLQLTSWNWPLFIIEDVLGPVEVNFDCHFDGWLSHGHSCDISNFYKSPVIQMFWETKGDSNKFITRNEKGEDPECTPIESIIFLSKLHISNLNVNDFQTYFLGNCCFWYWIQFYFPLFEIQRLWQRKEHYFVKIIRVYQNVSD